MMPVTRSEQYSPERGATVHLLRVGMYGVRVQVSDAMAAAVPDYRQHLHRHYRSHLQAQHKRYPASRLP